MKGLLSRATSCLKRSSPTILTCLSVAGFVGTTVLAVRATPKALAILDEATVEYCANGRTNHDDIQNLPKRLPFKETVQLTWKCYIPAALVGLSTVTCIVGINALSKRNQASLASAYAMLSESYQQYRKAANVVYGEDADSKIKAQMARIRTFRRTDIRYTIQTWIWKAKESFATTCSPEDISQRQWPPF